MASFNTKPSWCSFIIIRMIVGLSGWLPIRPCHGPSNSSCQFITSFSFHLIFFYLADLSLLSKDFGPFSHSYSSPDASDNEQTTQFLVRRVIIFLSSLAKCLIYSIFDKRFSKCFRGQSTLACYYHRQLWADIDWENIHSTGHIFPLRILSPDWFFSYCSPMFLLLLFVFNQAFNFNRKNHHSFPFW